MSFDLTALRDAIATHGRVARVVVAALKGSVPREVGASMLVWRGGQSGTIGGGALEFDAAATALETPGLRHIPLGPALGQCCGGHVSLLSEVFDAQSDLPSTDAPIWSRPVQGQIEMPFAVQRIERAARAGSWDGQPALQDGWFSEAVSPPRHPVWIYGAGHVGRALVDVLAPLPDFDITWIDTGLERFPERNDVRIFPARNPADVVRLAPKDASHLVLTYSHALDLEICHQLLSHGFGSAGLIGSATKWARFQSRLRTLGHQASAIGRIQCPIGDPALGKHPQAIAVSVAARMLSSDAATRAARARR